jgi:protein-disulfide isomerase
MPYHRNAPLAHRAARCAGEQSTYWQLHDALFLHQQEWSRKRRPARTIRSYARDLGLDLGRFDRCMDDPDVAADVERARRAAIALGVTAAPTFRIGKYLVTGAIPYDSLKTLVDIALREETGT